MGPRVPRLPLPVGSHDPHTGGRGMDHRPEGGRPGDDRGYLPQLPGVRGETSGARGDEGEILPMPRTRLQASLGVVTARHQTGEGQADYMTRLTADARAALAEEEGAAAARDLRRFLILVIRKLILGTRGDPVSCRCLPLLEDLTQVGSNAWGATLLSHLFDSLGTSSRETGVAGFFPLLQVWAYYHLPSLGRGVPRRPGAVPLLQRWQFCRNKRSLRLQVTLIHDALDTVPFGHVDWTPYAGEDNVAQPWVEQGRPYFGRDIWLHAFNTVVTDWTVRVRKKLTDWGQRGRAVTSEATSDEDYFRAYARRYGAQFDPEGRIASLEGVLHSTTGRGMTSNGGRCLFPRDEHGRSVLEGQLAAAVTLAEDALTQLREREAELRDALAWSIALATEMVELRLCPQADEATGLCREADELRLQLGEERHRCELLRSEMKDLERALALVGRSRSSASRSGIPSGSTGHYLTGSSRRRRNEAEARRRAGAAEGSTIGPREMPPPSSHPPEGLVEDMVSSKRMAPSDRVGGEAPVGGCP
ncbi:hypothetical protein Taro_017373 [Colocasia esculenta]|uniref:Aminotransferase-like plant mobile domain-containing protein n=1 Tax=Colocasia esculenta TaxID=4460 RepID=A0A843UT27_COLES|nr:hypothetical protein [Colocasia esculenta]